MALGRGPVIAAVAGVLVGASAMALASSGGLFGGGGSRGEVEQIVKSYILENPEIIPQAMDLLKQRETAQVVGANRAAFETPYGSGWAGAEKGDVVLVEFFDYACGYCRKSNAEVERLLEEDPKLKVVWREYPVLGQPSLDAAEVSLAAARQGRFREFFHAMFSGGRPTPEAIAAAGRAAGVQPMPAAPEHRAEIEKNYQLAQAIRSTGTPTFVVGDQVLHGAVGYDTLKKAIAAARART
jgi:protein-disulfide isomerase